MENGEFLISVIVPVYNVSTLLKRCVESLLLQTYANIEIVLVDDGSDDGSGAVCDELRKTDKRISVIHQNNEGITSARKTGLNNSTGEYVGFVDPDDWVEPRMYEVMLNILQAQGADLVCTGMVREKHGAVYATWNASNYPEGLYTGNELCSLVSKLFRNAEINISCSMCNKLFKRDLLKTCLNAVSNNIRGVGDDTACVIPYILKSGGVFITNQAFYHGCDREGSATRSRHETWFLQANLAYLRIKESIENSEYKEILKSDFEKLWEREIYIGLQNFFPEKYEFRFDYADFINTNALRVALYGAGKVGKSYYLQFSSIKNIEIVLWVDQNHKQIRMDDNIEVVGVEELGKGGFDKVIIAINNEEISKSLIGELSRKYQIDKKNIIWKRPLTFYEYGKNVGVLLD